MKRVLLHVVLLCSEEMYSTYTHPVLRVYVLGQTSNLNLFYISLKQRM